MDIKKYTKCRPFLCLRRGVSEDDVKARVSEYTFLCLRRGVSQANVPNTRRSKLFSAYAEVFLAASPIFAEVIAFLCLRRGVSDFISCQSVRLHFSLPTQRCFRNDLHAKFLQPAFLCLRRGVSSSGSVQSQFLVFSLPTQRCFLEKA